MIGWMAGAAAVLGGAFLIHRQDTVLDVTRYDIEHPLIPPSFDGYVIAHLSDYHNCRSRKLNAALLQAVRAAKPDGIFITGDLIESNAYSHAMELCRRLTAVAPVYYCTGNHEAMSGSFPRLLQGLRDLGVCVLSDSKITLRRNNQSVDVIGIDDPCFHFERRQTEQAAAHIKETLALLTTPDRYCMVLSHRPEYFDTYAQSDAHLIFCGHAHGGQWILPKIGPVYSPDQGLRPHYSSGRHEKNGTTEIISRGIGTSPMTFRIHNHPQLIVATLHTSMKTKQAL